MCLRAEICVAVKYTNVHSPSKDTAKQLILCNHKEYYVIGVYDRIWWYNKSNGIDCAGCV